MTTAEMDEAVSIAEEDKKACGQEDCPSCKLGRALLVAIAERDENDRLASSLTREVERQRAIIEDARIRLDERRVMLDEAEAEIARLRNWGSTLVADAEVSS